MYDEYDTFILAKELEDNTIKKGTRGVVLMILDTSPYTYEVEFPDDKGGNIGENMTYTITEQFMEHEE
jgi:hypothetical protein